MRYAVSDVNLKDSVYGGVELTGRIRNDTAERGSLVCVAAVLLDESEKPLGVVYTVLDSPLEAGASRSPAAARSSTSSTEDHLTGIYCRSRKGMRKASIECLRVIE